MYIEDALQSALQSLDRPHVTAFAAACAFRLFARRSQVDASPAVSRAIEAMLAWAADPTSPLTAAEELRTALQAQLPAIDDGAHEVNETAVSLIYAIQQAASGEVPAALWCARRNIEDIDANVQARLGPGAVTPAREQSTIADDAYQSELAAQQEDLRALSASMAGGGEPRLLVAWLQAKLPREFRH